MKSTRSLIAGALALAWVTLACLTMGCARHENDPAVVAASTGEGVAPPRTTSETPTASAGDGYAAVSGDSLPPDVAATIADSLVTPGSIVEITAEGSADVVEVSLSDGIGKRQKFAYDAAGDVWRVSYRVPIKTPSERLGLSVTATNGLGRWRRVWVFLNVPREEVPAPPAPVSEK